VENSRRRDDLIHESGVQYGSAKDFLDRKNNELESHLAGLEREKENNRGTESNI